jgi:transcriptional regulator GlxA family with amidase domain
VLNRRKPVEKRLMAVLFDQIASAAEVDLTLPMPRAPHARRFVALLEAHLGEDSPIAELARRSGTSLRTLERSFIADTGVRVGEWRRRFRLLHAMRLLEGGAPVTSVALDVGYASTSAFTAAFTRHFGVPPTRRRRS